MKKLIAIFMVFATLTAMMCATTAHAVSNIKVVVNDTMVAFPDAQPFVDANNRTLIPVRFVTEAMKANVSWVQETQTAVIEKDGTKVEITIGKQDIKVTKNGATQTVTMDTAAVNKQDRTFVPIRFVAEALGAYVDYSNLYRVVEIVMPDEVTAAEIKRLRSYPMNQTMDLSIRDNDNNAWWMDREEYKSFTGNYWFSNSHFFLVTMEEPLGYEVKNEWSSTVAPANSNALDYARFAVKYANDHMETTGYPSLTGKFNIPGPWNNGACEIKFRTSDALAYQMVCPPQAIISVRGVMDYTVEHEWGINMLKVQFGEENPEIGKTYSYDIELQMSVNSRYFMDAPHIYWLKPDGSVKEIKNSVNN